MINFIEITLWYWCSPVNLLHIFRTFLPKSTFGGLLLIYVFLKSSKPETPLIASPLNQSPQKRFLKEYTLLLKTILFLSHPQHCLIFPRIQLQMLLRCCLLHITIIILIHILYLVYICTYLRLVLFILYLCDPFLIFSLIFILINHIISLKQTNLFFAYFLENLMLGFDSVNG